MPHKYRHITAPVTIGLLAGLILALGPTLKTTLQNSYISHGFCNTIVFLLSSGLARFLLPALAVAVVLTIATASWDRLRGGADRFAALLLGLLAGLAFLLTEGYVYNRYKLPVVWNERRDVFGLGVPEPLFQWQVWKVNIIITLGALGIGLGVWLVSRWALRDINGPGRRVWRFMGHPIPFVLVLLLALGPLVTAKTLRRAASGRPNLLLISLDALRADHLGSYGYFRNTSPEMDKLAAQGIRFEWAICQAPTTLPSHMSIFTSVYPTVHGARMDRRAAKWRLTLPEYLREHGYRTAGCTDGGYMSGDYGLKQGFDIYDDRYKGSRQAVPRILRWLDKDLSDGPFFVFFHTYDIHSPYDPPKPWTGMYTDPDYDGGFNPTSSKLERIRRRVNENPEGGHGLAPEDIQFVMGLYDGGISYVDHWMGRLVRGLEERGLLESTWIVITADHGEEFTEHGAFLHGKLYHTCAHVPLIIRPAGTGKAGRTIPEIVELIDLMPTFLELAGIAPVDTLQGRSLLPLIEGDRSTWKNIAFSEHHSRGGRRAVTSPTLHVITSLEHGEVEVYDYHADPLEQVPLDDPSRADEVRDLLSTLRQWIQAQILLAASQEGTEPVEIDQATIEELRALGYID